MVHLTKSLEHFLFMHYPDILVPLSFGHTELLTQDIWNEYIEWCKTDKGKLYLN